MRGSTRTPAYPAGASGANPRARSCVPCAILPYRASHDFTSGSRLGICGVGERCGAEVGRQQHQDAEGGGADGEGAGGEQEQLARRRLVRLPRARTSRLAVSVRRVAALGVS